MINAKEAREMTTKSETAINLLLKRYDAKVRAAAETGGASIDLEVDEEVQLGPVMSIMKDQYGYYVQQMHSKGFRIKWITA